MNIDREILTALERIENLLYGIAKGKEKRLTIRQARFLATDSKIATFVSDCCEVDEILVESNDNLYAAYKLWAQTTGNDVGKAPWQALSRLGYKRIHTGTKRGYQGLRLKGTTASILNISLQ